MNPKNELDKIKKEISKEIFRSPHIGIPQPLNHDKNIAQRLHDLLQAKFINWELYESLRDYLSSVDNCANKDKVGFNKLINQGVNLILALRRSLLIGELVDDFEHHLIWHHYYRRDIYPNAYKSVIAAMINEFEYDINVFHEAVDIFNRKEKERAERNKWEPIEMPKISLNELVEIIEFRKKELERIINENSRENLYFKWPIEWGETGWNGHVIRNEDSAQDELIILQNALEHYKD